MRFDGSFFFANAPDFADEIRTGVEMAEPTPRVVLVDGEAITDIDATAIVTISELNDELARGGVGLRFAHVQTHVLDIISRGDREKKIDPDKFYLSVQDGVDAYLAEQE